MARRRRVTELRPLTDDDAAALARWLPRVAKDMGCARWASEDALRRAVGREDVLAIIERRGAPTRRGALGDRMVAPTTIEDEPSGLLAYEVGAPKRNAALVRFLAIDPDRRRLGIGGRAALALEERLSRPTKRLYVSVPARLGLAFYFWLRLGYRPLTRGDWPVEPEESPSVWVVRELR